MYRTIVSLFKYFTDCTIEGDIHLIGGANNYEGRVEVCHDGEWRTVCDSSYWGVREGTVACQQLGYSFVRVHSSGSFGRGRRQPWLSYLSCSGYEGRLIDCRHPDGYYCANYDDAGLVCKCKK